MQSLAEFLSHFTREDTLPLAVEPDGDVELRLAGLKAVARDLEDFSSDEQLVQLTAQVILDLVENLAASVPCAKARCESRAAILRALARRIFEEESECGTIFRTYGFEPPWIEEQWTWPTVNKELGKKSGGFLDLENQSALGLFGYSVAKSNAGEWPDTKRHQFLSDFVEKNLPSVVSQTFGDSYGKPLTTDRLRKTAQVIAGNCSLRYKQDPWKYRHAIGKWEMDLNFLKKKFYVGMGMRFSPWPDPRGHS
jgi:hypothetical protein